MEQLLEIRTVPISMEFCMQNATLEMSCESPSHKMTKIDGSLRISHQYPRLHIDTYDARSSMELKTALHASKDAAKSSMQAAMEATASIVQEGNTLMDIQNGNNIPTMIQDIELQRIQSSLECTVGSAPTVPAKIDWEPGQLKMQYEADKLLFDWRTENRAQMQYSPAKVEYLVKEYPHLEIEYIGKPLYVPPSASPDYEPTVMDVSA